MERGTRRTPLKRASLVVLTLLLCGIGWGISPVHAQTVVNFPDPGLEGAIREAIGKPTGDIYDTDLVGLTYLCAGWGQISDLSGIEYCINLTGLYLSNNEITDIGPLANLTDLFELDLDGNQITDITPLAGLTKLQDLGLMSNDIEEIDALTGLTDLWCVALGDNEISDVSPLAGLTELVELDLDGNQITEIGPLAGLTKLEFLIIANNYVSDIRPLAGLANLFVLALDGNLVTDIDPLAGLLSLEILALINNGLSDVGALGGLTNLCGLYLDHNAVSEIQPLVANTGLDLDDRVSLIGNPLSVEAQTVQIPALEGRGVRVFFEPAGVVPEYPTVSAGDYLHFTMTFGGDGWWWVACDPSGGHIDRETGIYQAGPGGGVTDVVLLSWYDKYGSTAVTVAVTARPGGSVGPATSMDVDGGGVGLSDVILMLKDVVGLEELTSEQAEAADFDCDGSVGLGDVLNALRVVVGLAPLV